jgi:hypothetical protein
MLKLCTSLLASLGLWLCLTFAAQAQTNCLVPPNNPATPVVSASAEGSHILKASPGCLIAAYVYNSGAAGFLLIFNSATVPADGAVTPIHCLPVAAASYQFVNFAPLPPEWYSAGIVAVVSTTGCFTKTIGSGAFFHALVQ